MNGTYSVEDNKLRLYSTVRLGADNYARVKEAGFKWAPKQEVFVAPAWTPGREDLLLELCGEIGDEDYSPTERAADRAERFEEYRDRRAGEAGASADTFDSGPAAFGHQNRARAERLAEKHDRNRTRAVSQWGKAEYWHTRTAAVIAHALYKSSAGVRRGRILTLEADQRKHEKGRAEHAERFAGWSSVATLEGADRAGKYVRTAEGSGFEKGSVSPALRVAYDLANYGGCSLRDYTHPRNPERVGSLFTLLTDETDPITPAEAAALWLAIATDPIDPDSNAARWSDHYANRLGYERAMLAQEGGTAADADMEPGGWIGKHQIHGINKSPVTGKVVSVKLMAPEKWYRGEGVAPLTLQSFNVERLPEGAYRAPTADEKAEFLARIVEAKAEKKATAPKAPALINPTDADAERLQALWNKRAAERYAEYKRTSYSTGELAPVAVRRMTQAEYSARSAGSYGTAETVEVCANGFRPPSYLAYNATRYPVACKVRKTYGGGGFTGQADAVILITDKPQKALPLDWSAIEAGTGATAEPVAV